MTQTATVVLDNEAVQALLDAAHPKRRQVIALLEAARQRAKKTEKPITFVVPTAVRVEAGWDRTAPGAAFANATAPVDAVLSAIAANRAVQLRAAAPGLSPVDAAIGAAAAEVAKGVLILTSDEPDMKVVAGLIGDDVVVHRL